LNNKIRHIFISIFVFCVFSLTLQASVIQLCKDSKIFKNQSQQNPISEEEEEKSHDSDDEHEHVYYINYENIFYKSILENKWFLLITKCTYPSFTKTIPIPPPKL
jgi:hypothetical protein